ncbi:LysM peptidoglycan-binding domain-containing protein [Cognatiyoonia sp. IB215182]|uniref:LysM peptidoglycan-binding domain-containing protein n=1 Tax=Cognatiyoonia sp. IB215182 TaxID=3097353 RepID=UPI002A122189|nr:transporter substrate-binding domain-containing protein [Cognatiyoonia sp. IB215182]MDX8353357.1 transporter substrate-binding domain-containing protein [Cognatiyoonia sp. IB215182]
MTKRVVLAAIVAAAGATATHAQEACSVYTVQPGDTLSVIAREAYGSISFQEIWDANRNVIGANPNIISVGMELSLPCADGSLPGSGTVQVSVATPVPEVTAAETKTIRLVTGTGYPPYTDEGLEGGGVYTQLVRAAMDTMEPRYETEIIFVNDWGSHLETLLPARAFDGAFPWLRPNCEAPETLTENSKFRCDGFLHSDPFYEIITGLATRSDDALATTTDAADFAGKSLCLPSDYSDVGPTSLGLGRDVMNYVQPANPDDCFTALMAGEVDAVALVTAQSEDIAQRMGIAEQVAINPHLTSADVLAVFVDKDNPDAAEIISALNEGLENIRESGEWFQTVRAGFSAYYNQ